MRKQTTSFETDEDEVVAEVDVFLSKTLADKLYLFHYPTKLSVDEPEQVECLSAKIKPKQQKLEFEFKIDTDTRDYDKSRGEQFAMNVDAINPSGEAYFKSSLMDKYVFTATSPDSRESANNYAIGFLRKGELHITPLHAALELKQNFNYMDRMENSSKKSHASAEEEEEEEEAVAVTVRFEGPNAEKDKQMREKSYQYLQQKNASEPWMNVNFHQYHSYKSKMEYDNLVCPQMYNDATSCSFTPDEYLKVLIPECLHRGSSEEGTVSAKPNQPLSDQIKQLFMNAHVLRFSSIIEQLPSDVDINSVEQLIQQIAVLVQGCWVAKSEVLHAEDSVSVLTGISGKYLINARDYVVWLYTKSRVITRRDVLTAICIPDVELTSIISQLAIKSDRGWEFKYLYDAEFIESHRSIELSQEIKWDLRYKKLVKELNIGQTQKLPCPVLPRKQKRLSRSSLSEDGDESGTDTSSSSHKDNKSKRAYTAKKRMNVSPVKHPSKSSKPFHIATLDISPTFLEITPSDEVKAQLKECLEEAIRNQYVMTLSSLKELISENHLSALSSRNDFEQLIDEALLNCGAQKLKNKWPQNTTPEPLYAFWKFGNKLDRYRNILLELFSTTARTRINFFIKTVEDELREIISENDSRQIFEEYCSYKSGFFYLKGTISLDS